MTDFLRTVKARHKWDAFWILWCLAWFVLDVATGSYIAAVVMAAFGVFFVVLAVWSERNHRDHVRRMDAIRNATTAEELIALIRKR